VIADVQLSMSYHEEVAMGWRSCSVLVPLLGSLLLMILIPACSNTHEYSGAPPTIDSQHEVIMLKATAGGVDDVRFRHKVHADYYDNTCMVCHSHTSARDTTIWGCSSCHAANDAQGLCGTTGDGHACMSRQCLLCHEQLAANPTPLCTQCHIPRQSGVFADAPVMGLDYRTQTQRGTTDAMGGFLYLAGETITFSIGNLTIGSALARPVMTPLDLVSTATSETDPTVTNICRLLQTLDENGSVSDGITIPFAVWNAAWNRNILFSVPTASFGLQPDLVSLLATLNNAGVFSDGAHTLMSAGAAQANFRATLDALYPPPAAVQVRGPLNTHFVLAGAFAAAGDPDYLFQWYRADSAAGANQAVIPGSTAKAYAPVPADVGKWLAFEVTPYYGGSSYGTPVRSAWTGTVSSSSTALVFASLGSAAQVDTYTLRLQTAGTVTMNIESYEAWNSSCSDFFCGSCHVVSTPGPSDLGFSGTGTGCSNDKLITNAFLFTAPSGSLDTLVSAKTGTAPCSGAGGATGYPGCDAPGAFSTRSGFNPYMSSTLSSGDYVLAVGSQGLSEADARNGTNTGGASYFISSPDPEHWGYLMYYGSRYRITFTFP
jgi:hypothetical protein